MFINPNDPSLLGVLHPVLDGPHYSFAYFPLELNWLDPELDRESSDYESYTEESHDIERDVGIVSTEDSSCHLP